MAETTTETTTTTTAPTWFAGLDEEHIGHIQTKGWDKGDLATIAPEIVKAHRAAEKMTGAPADQLLRLPKPEDSDAWGAVWKRLGAPEKPEGYDFTAIEFDEPGLTTRFHDAMRAAAVKLNMPKTMAEEFAKAVHKTIGDYGEAQETEQSAQLAEQRAKLVENWGPEDGSRFKGNMFVADRAAERLSVTPEQFAKLKEGLGGAGVAELFRKIGEGMGEDKLVRDPGAGGRDVMTREQATARKAELLGDGRPGTGDAAFQKRYAEGDVAARREIAALIRLIVGDE